MKPLYLSLLVVLLFHCGCQKEKNCTKDKEENKPTGTDWRKPATEIWYAQDGVTEISKRPINYDSQGRFENAQCIINGNLSWEQHNYTYTGNECVFQYDEYSSGALTNSSKHKMVDAGNWLKLSLYATYSLDGSTELSRITYSYDANGQKTGEQHFSMGKLYAGYSDYTYSGNEVTFYYKRYLDGVATSATKYRQVNFSNWVLLNSEVTYASDGVTEQERTDDIFDTEGRRMNRKIYRYGTLIQEWKDYVYTDNECTFNAYNVSSGTTQKAKMIFFKW